MFMCMDAEIARRKAREAHPLKREPFEGSLAAGGEDARRGARIVPPAPALRRRRVARCAPRACRAARPLAARRRLPHDPPSPPRLPHCVCTEGGGVVHAGLVGATARSKGGGKGDGAAAADHAGSAAATVSLRVA